MPSTSGDQDEHRYHREKAVFEQYFSGHVRRPADRFYSIWRANTRYYESLILSHGSARRVLEYGCGTGSSAFLLAEHGAAVTGIDLSDEGIRSAKAEAQARGTKLVHFLTMNAEHLDFPNGAFDLVCGTAILHHLNLDRAFSEVRRVLVANGVAVFMEPLGMNPLINFYRRLTPNMRTPDEHPLVSEDLALASRYFRLVDIHYFHLWTLLAVPLARLRIFEPILTSLEALDTAVFSRLPFMRRYGWYCVMRCREPL
jgi:SAM-dependent methyltransferase